MIRPNVENISCLSKLQTVVFYIHIFFKLFIFQEMGTTSWVLVYSTVEYQHLSISDQEFLRWKSNQRRTTSSLMIINGIMYPSLAKHGRYWFKRCIQQGWSRRTPFCIQANKTKDESLQLIYLELEIVFSAMKQFFKMAGLLNIRKTRMTSCHDCSI